MGGARDRAMINALCVPAGFTPTGAWEEEAASGPLFVPLKKGGYAL